jgi:hypothetical protein
VSGDAADTARLDLSKSLLPASASASMCPQRPAASSIASSGRGGASRAWLRRVEAHAERERERGRGGTEERDESQEARGEGSEHANILSADATC